jgi:hypothetical protein
MIVQAPNILYMGGPPWWTVTLYPASLFTLFEQHHAFVLRYRVVLILMLLKLQIKLHYRLYKHVNSVLHFIRNPCYHSAKYFGYCWRKFVDH